MTKFDCEQIMFPDVSNDTATYRDVIDTMDYRGYKNTLPVVGTDSVKKIAELAAVFETITDRQMLDKKASEAVNGFSALGQMKAGKEISCVFEFEGGAYPLVAYLDESYAQSDLCRILLKKVL